MDFDNYILVGINEDCDLVGLELNYNDLNKGTKFYNPHYYLTPHGFTDIKDAEKGEEEARERLEDADYWEEIGYLDHTKNNPLMNHIDFKGLADEVLSNDGWYMTNGEYYYFSHLEDGEYYLNLSWVGFEEKTFDKKNYKKLYLSDEDFKFICSLPKEIKEDSKEYKELKKIQGKYQDKHIIIKDMLELQE